MAHFLRAVHGFSRAAREQVDRRVTVGGLFLLRTHLLVDPCRLLQNVALFDLFLGKFRRGGRRLDRRRCWLLHNRSSGRFHGRVIEHERRHLLRAGPAAQRRVKFIQQRVKALLVFRFSLLRPLRRLLRAALLRQKFVRRDRALALFAPGRGLRHRVRLLPAPLPVCQRRIVDRQIKLRPRRAALRALDLLLRNVVDDRLRGVGMLVLRLVIFRARAVTDGGDNAGDRHIECGDELQQQRRQQHNRRTDIADEHHQPLGKQPAEHAAGHIVNARLPQRRDQPVRPGGHATRKNVHQRADGHAQQHRARHAQHHRASVVQQQDDKAHQKRKRQYVQPRADQPPKQDRQHVQTRCVDAEARQCRAKPQQQAHDRADFTPDGALCLCRALAAALRLLCGAARGSRFFRLFSGSHVISPHATSDRISVTRPAPQQ